MPWAIIVPALIAIAGIGVTYYQSTEAMKQQAKQAEMRASETKRIASENLAFEREIAVMEEGERKDAAKAELAKLQLQAEAAEDAAAANVLAQELETAEEARRMEGQHEQQSAEARARAAASGTTPGSRSSGAVIGSLQAEQAEQLAWLEKSGASKAEILQLEGDYNRELYDAAALGKLFGGVNGEVDIWG